jgi:hypothetical protein
MIRKLHAALTGEMVTAYEIGMGKLRRRKDTTGIRRYKQGGNIKTMQ